MRSYLKVVGGGGCEGLSFVVDKSAGLDQGWDDWKDENPRKVGISMGIVGIVIFDVKGTNSPYLPYDFNVRYLFGLRVLVLS